MIFLQFVFTFLFTSFSKQMYINTGRKDSIFSQKQEIQMNYKTIHESVKIYYQYFKKLNLQADKDLAGFASISDNQSDEATTINPILFYIGHNVTYSAIAHAYQGILPYTFKKDKDSQIGVDVTFNSNTLNKAFDIVAVDIVRGSGFNINQNSTQVTYELISQDL